MGKGNKDKKKLSMMQAFREGFAAVHLLDNQNIYGVIASEAISNIFKEGMWIKVLSPYTLILSGGDRILVGNTITLNGVTRAVVGVTSGRVLIDKWGVDNIFVATGFLGVMGILVNFYCLLQGSITAIFFLNFIWAVFNGLWNSCMETEWAKSIVQEKRTDVNGARQATNKATTAMGPFFSLLLFLYVGDKWTIPLIRFVMLFGTAFTCIPVMLCFTFRREAEVHQIVPLAQISKFEFPSGSVDCNKLGKADFAQDPKGKVKLTYPLSSKSKFGKLRILTKDLRETKFILGKQYSANFKNIPIEEDVLLVHFNDEGRRPVRAMLDRIAVFLNSDEIRSLNSDLSIVYFDLYPDLGDHNKPKTKWSLVRTMQRILAPKSVELDPAGIAAVRHSRVGDALKTPLLQVEADESGKLVQKVGKLTGRKRADTNIRGANVIVLCDVLNAFGTGMSLKFMDLFLIQDYGMSPAAVLAVAVGSNLLAAWLTPAAKSFITRFKKYGYQSKLAVVAIWTAANICLGVICIPDVPCWLAVLSIVLMNGLGSSTKAFNRAKLVNYLPNDRIANYMAWDSLNKANQGGVAVFGAQLMTWGGYRLCFMCTFAILLVRIMIYFVWAVSSRNAKKLHNKSTFLNFEDLDEFDVDQHPGAGGEAASELFLDSDLRISREGELEEREERRASTLAGDAGYPQVMVLDTIEDNEDEASMASPPVYKK